MRVTVLILVLIIQLQAGNYYVNNNNPQSGNGTIANPFKTVAAGLNVLSPGDTLFVRGSVTGDPQIYSETPNLGDSFPSGSAGKRITVKAFPGEQVRFNLSGSFSVYPAYWQFQNLIYDLQNQNYDLIKLRGDNNIFDGCTIRNGQKDGFDIADASGNLIRNCRIYHFTNSTTTDAHGIVLDGGDNNTFSGNEIYDCKGDCIQLITGDNTNTVIEYNHLYTTLGSGSENAIDMKGTHSTTIRGNKMHGFHDAEDSDGVALKINKNSDNVTIEDNDIFESNGGFRISGGEAEHIIFRRNRIHNLHIDSGETQKYGYGIQFDGVTDIEVTSNTFVNIPGPIFWIASNGADDIDMRNNLFYNTGHLYSGDASDLRGVVDYNGWFNAVEKISGAHDITGSDPKMEDEPNRDFHLKKDSPAVNSGDPLNGSDYPGGRIDLGAFEYGSATAVIFPPTQPGGRTFLLHQNYPNPFNPATVIAYSLQGSGRVRISISDVLGKKIATIFNETQDSGRHQVRWQPAPELPGGIYFAQVFFNGQSQVLRLFYLK